MSVKTVLVGTILVLYAVLTFFRVQVFHDDLALWTDAVSKAPCFERPLARIAMAHEALGHKDEAILGWQRLLDLKLDGRCGPR